MRLIFIGDIYGRSGREAVEKHLPDLKDSFKPDIILANGENAAHGLGITKKITEDLFNLGVDCITSGDHIWDQREIISLIDQQPNLLRPLNIPKGAPGKGYVTIQTGNGHKILVVNVMARTFMEPIDCPFRAIENLLKDFSLKRQVDAIFIDFHGEATSEKMAFGHFLDGRVSGVVGTHTHVPTADAHILEKGTAYQTDAGMSGDYDSVIGRRKDIAIYGFLRKMPGEKPVPSSGAASLCGAYIEIDDATGLAKDIQSFRCGGALAG